MTNRNLIMRLQGFRIALTLCGLFWMAVIGIIALTVEVVK